MNKSFLPYAFGKKKWKPVGIASIPCIDEFYNTFPQLHLVGTMKALHENGTLRAFTHGFRQFSFVCCCSRYQLKINGKFPLRNVETERKNILVPIIDRIIIHEWDQRIRSLSIIHYSNANTEIDASDASHFQERLSE